MQIQMRTRNEPFHQDLHCLPVPFWVLTRTLICYNEYIQIQKLKRPFQKLTGKRVNKIGRIPTIIHINHMTYYISNKALIWRLRGTISESSNCHSVVSLGFTRELLRGCNHLFLSVLPIHCSLPSPPPPPPRNPTHYTPFGLVKSPHGQSVV